MDLRQRQLHQRLLGALLDAHAQHPGEPVSVDELLQRGWPGERGRRDAMERRLWVALSKLRKLDLAPILDKEEGGYVLPRRVKVLHYPDLTPPTG